MRMDSHRDAARRPVRLWRRGRGAHACTKGSFGADGRRCATRRVRSLLSDGRATRGNPAVRGREGGCPGCPAFKVRAALRAPGAAGGAHATGCVHTTLACVHALRALSAAPRPPHAARSYARQGRARDAGAAKRHAVGRRQVGVAGARRGRAADDGGAVAGRAVCAGSRVGHLRANGKPGASRQGSRPEGLQGERGQRLGGLAALRCAQH